ncbi:Uncharacterized protein FWK35_00018138 [Aphis craccivora]|uniref:Uncharacterized protein n=1 Tax=Aphis craccivora TaxID=307492 RepID=A0A6G0Y2T8_APHCR|nr:Uncharacterized protein FWK35_00018138 [Aphis craccivora]
MDSNVFISVGLDASVLLNCVVHINVNSRFSLLENLNFSKPEYLHTDEYKIITVLQCRGVNIVSIKCLLDDQSRNAAVIGPQAAFSKVCKSFGVYEQYPFKQDENPGDFIFCTSIPFISYRVSENKNANPLFEKQTSPTTSVDVFTFPSM